MRFLILFTIIVVLSSAKCEKDEQTPKWLNKLISTYQDEPVKNPPIKIYQYIYKNQNVYYIPSFCCDIPSRVLDEKGNLVCSPDGGFTGKGDGNCPNFFEIGIEKKIVWADPR